VADLETILHHRREMFAEMGHGDEGALDAMVSSARSFIEGALRDGSYRAWLVEADGRVVSGGGVAIVAYQPTPRDPLPRRAFVLNMYTEPAYCRQGLAREVLETIIAWSRREGLRAVLLHASNAGRPLYQKLGFEPTNEMRLLLG
jgi:GNAT superfamily N-acetyltransferase